MPHTEQRLESDQCLLLGGGEEGYGIFFQTRTVRTGCFEVRIENEDGRGSVISSALFGEAEL